MKRKILLYIFILNLILSINILAFNVNIKGGIATKQDITERISTTANTANNGTTKSDTPTKLALDAEISFYTGANIEVGGGIKYGFMTISTEAASTALSEDILLTDLTGYGMFKVNYDAYNQDGEALSASPYLQVNVGLPVTPADAGDGSYTLVGKQFYELAVGVEYLDTAFELSYTNSRYELDEQTNLTYIDVETINFKIGVKFRLFEGGGNNNNQEARSSLY